MGLEDLYGARPLGEAARRRRERCVAERLAKSPGVEARVVGPAESREMWRWSDIRVGRGFYQTTVTLPSDRDETPFSYELAERGHEAFVLSIAPQRHPQRSGAPQGVAGPDKHAALAQSRDDLGPRRPSSGSCSQMKFASDSATHRPSARTPPSSSGRRLPARPGARPRPGGGEPRPRPPEPEVEVERLADLVDCHPEVRSSRTAVADAQYQRAVDLRERPQQYQRSGTGAGARPTRMCPPAPARTRRRPHRGLRTCGVALGPGNPRSRRSPTEVEVGLLGLQTRTSRVATVISPTIASSWWRSSASSGTSIARAPDGGGEVRIDAERRPGVHDLRSRLEQRLAAASRMSHDPFPSAIRSAATP